MARANAYLRQLKLSQPKLGPGGLHAPDCECTRCETGHRTTYDQWNRAVAEARARKAADRKTEKQEEKQSDTYAEQRARIAQTREWIQKQEAVRAQSQADPRIRRYHELRSTGMGPADAMKIVDGEFPENGNDNGN